MLQAVCIKQVADTETRVKVGPDGKTLDPAGVTWILNPYDEFALEQALRIKEKLGAGEVVVVSLGGASVQTTLRNALAMGADRAVHLKVDATQPDPLVVAKALAAELQTLGPGSCGSASRRSTTIRPRSDPWWRSCLDFRALR